MELETEDVVHHFKKGEISVIMYGGGLGMGKSAVLEALKDRGGTVLDMEVDDLDEILERKQAETLAIDELEPMIMPDKKRRRGKRKRDNPYRYTMKQGR